MKCNRVNNERKREEDLEGNNFQENPLLDIWKNKIEYVQAEAQYESTTDEWIGIMCQMVNLHSSNCFNRL